MLRQYVRPYRGLVAVVMLLQLVSTLASLYLPTVNAAIIDDGVARGDTDTIVELGGVMLVVTALPGRLRRRRGVLRVAGRHGLRAGPARGDVPPRHHLLRARDLPVRRADVVDPHHQRRPADPGAGADDVHRAGDGADHVRRRADHGDSPGCRVVLAAAGERAGAGPGERVDHPPHAADLPQHAAADRRHQPGDARAAVGHPGDPGVRPGAVRTEPLPGRPTPICRTPPWMPAAGRR